MNPCGLLFDFDFTLADPTGWLIPAWKSALEAIGKVCPPRDEILKLVGRTLEVQYSSITGFKPEGSKFEKFRANYIAFRDSHAGSGTEIIPGVPETLRALSMRNLTLGIVSTGADHRIREILARHKLLAMFSVIEAGCANKDEGIRRAARRLSCATSEVFYIGDHPDDREAAILAGAPFVAVLTGVHTRTDFAPGTKIVLSIELLPQLLASGTAVL